MHVESDTKPLQASVGRAGTGLVRTSALISAASLISGLVSFATQAVLARLFGSGADMAAYLVGTSIPLLFSGLVGILVSVSIVPVLVHQGEDPEERLDLEGRLFWILTAGCLAISLMGIASARLVVHLVAPNLTHPLVAVHSNVLSWGAFALMTLMSYNGAVWNARSVFVRPALAALGPSIGALAAAVSMGRWLGPAVVAAGTLVGAGVGYLVLAFGLRPRLRTSEIANRHAIQALRRAPLILASISVFTIYGTIDALFGSRLGPHVVTYLGYGQRIVIGIGALVIAGPMMVMLPLLSTLSREGKDLEFKRVTGKAVQMVLALSIGIAAVVAILREQVIGTLLQRGSFTIVDTETMSRVFGLVALGMAPMLATSVVIQAFYANKDLVAAAKIGICGTIGYIVLAGVFSSRFGLVGFGWAYLSNWLCVLTACLTAIFTPAGFVSAMRRQSPFLKETVPSVVVASLSVFSLTAVLRPVAPTPRAYLGALIGCPLGFAIYLICCRLIAPKGIVASLIDRLSGKWGRPEPTKPGGGDSLA